MKSDIDGIAVIDENREFKYIDQSFARLYGYSAGPGIIGKSWTETYERIHLRRFEEEILPVLEEEDWWSGVLFGVRSQGERFSQKAFVFKLGKDQLVFLVKNISPRRRSLFEIGQPELNWPEAVVSPPDIVAIISTDYEIKKINSRGAKKLGKDSEDLKGKHCFDVVHQQNSPVAGCPCQKTIESGEAGIGEVHEGGENFVVTSFPLQNRSGKTAAFLHTVTEVESSPPGELRACDFFLRGLTELDSKEGMYSFLLNFLSETLGTSKITIYEKKGDKLVCEYQIGYKRPIKGDKLYLSGSGIRIKSFLRNETRSLSKVGEQDNFIRYDPEVCCEVVSPISTDDNKFGLVDIRRYKPDSITCADKNLIEVTTTEVANQLEQKPPSSF